MRTNFGHFFQPNFSKNCQKYFAVPFLNTTLKMMRGETVSCHRTDKEKQKETKKKTKKLLVTEMKRKVEKILEIEHSHFCTYCNKERGIMS